MEFDIRNVKNITDLIRYFSLNLGWEIDIDDFDNIEDISYDFDAEDIGLKEESFARISSLRQLQPLVDGQQWGIFCVEFDSNKFESSALRKILSGLIPRRRNSANHAVWCQQDLLFICNWGQENNRTIGIAHFEDKEIGLPQIKMISCAPALEDFTQIKVFENRLAQLAWPRNTSNIQEWRQAWSSAFTTAYRQTIQDSSTLTIQLAAEAQNIRNCILDTLNVETQNGYVHTLYDKFRSTLIHDMTEQQFADMYAQTVVYGLFSARCMDKTQDDFSAEEAFDCIPNTNPFLKNLMKECLGAQNNSKLSFDELEIGNVVELLKHTKTKAIIEDFNRQTGGGKEDPVIHFYEEFLTAYDKTQKVQRGVYYTPQPVVNFIVRAVDDIIKRDFNLEDGLAAIETKKIKVTRQSKYKVDGYSYRQVEDVIDVPAIQVLDPATGTGTFIRQVILQIYETFKKKNKDLSNDELKKAWNVYVPEHLLPRINAFELMMAPYAVAHMKLAMVLRDTGYEFKSNSRLNVYLTNSLEKPSCSDGQLTFWSDPLATESIAANAVKKNKGLNIIIGNPPYAGASANTGEWITSLIANYKIEPGGEIHLHERNPKWINDDYVKFIRYAQLFSEYSEDAILAYICPHGFLSNPTFRGMRWRLLQTYNTMYFIDLHGNSNRKETCPDGSKDENVFDIQQGVGIALLIKKHNAPKHMCKVFSADIYGLREYKYHVLNSSKLTDISFEEVMLSAPLYLFKKHNDQKKVIYEKGVSITELFPLNGVGITTAHDDFVMSTRSNSLIDRFERFKRAPCDDNLYEKFNVKRKEGWDIIDGWKNLQDSIDISQFIQPICYRPFDTRYIFYEDKLVWRTVRRIMEHMIPDNIGFVTARSNKGTDSSHFFIADHMMEAKYAERTTQAAIFPLYIYKKEFGKLIKCVNLNKAEIRKFEIILQKQYLDENKDGYESFDALDIFYYIYAWAFSDTYRREYHEFLNIDFPRFPYPEGWYQFTVLKKYGEILVNAHLLRMKQLSPCSLCGNGDNSIDTYIYKNGCIRINKQQAFFGVPKDAWLFLIGGYQPLQKWLKDRKGEKLSTEDINHYIEMVGAVIKTIEVMEEIDSFLEDEQR